MHIAILGCRGIPNRYGGFEQFASYLAEELVSRGINVTVYCSHFHPEKSTEFRGIRRVMIFDPEKWLGNAGQIIYDLLCILDARKRNYDIIYQLGYTSCGLWQWLLPTNTPVVSNMDGLEWSRAKYGFFAKGFLRWSERKVALRSGWLVADAMPIQQYLDNTYQKKTIFLSYATPAVHQPDLAYLEYWQVKPGRYCLVIARLQPDNHIEEAIQGVLQSGTDLPLLIVGNTASSYGKKLERQYASRTIQFLGSIFEKEVLDALRAGSAWYFHGHSAGGTNPSLLESMAAAGKIVAHDNPFNRSILKKNAQYFTSSDDIGDLLQNPESEEIWETRIQKNRESILKDYSLDRLTNSYLAFFQKVLSS